MKRVLFLLLIFSLLIVGCTNKTVEKTDNSSGNSQTENVISSQEDENNKEPILKISKSSVVSSNISGDIELFQPIKVNDENIVALYSIKNGENTSFFVKGYNQNFEEKFSTEILPTEEYKTIPYKIINIDDYFYVLEGISKIAKFDNTISVRKYDLQGNELWQKENQNYDRLCDSLVCTNGKVYAFGASLICTLDNELQDVNKIGYPIVIKRDVAHEFKTDFTKLKIEQIDAGKDFVLLGMRIDYTNGYVAKVNLDGDLEWAKEFGICKAMGVFDDEIALVCEGETSGSISFIRLNLDGEIINKVDNIKCIPAKFAVIQKVGNYYAFQIQNMTSDTLYDIIFYDENGNEVENDFINDKYGNITIFGEGKALNMITEKYDEKDTYIATSEVKMHEITIK